MGEIDKEFVKKKRKERKMLCNEWDSNPGVGRYLYVK
jgi:hypothetical protein